MTDLELDIWNEWLRQKQKALEDTLSSLSPDDDLYHYCMLQGHINGLIDALTMLTTVESGKRFRSLLNGFRKELLASGEYDAKGNYIHSKKINSNI